MILFIPLFAAILPFILWPIEIFLPYPHIIEEVAKASLVFLLRSDTLQVHNADTYRYQLKIIIISGFLFALSESVLYLLNIYLVGDLNLFILRLILTIFLHLITLWIIFILSIKSIKLIIPGILIAILIHYAFNLFLASF